MQTLNQPTLLLKPFAESGDKNTIPVTNTDVSEPQRADLTNGFPEVTSLDPDDGGIPAERKDFNALGYLTTSYDYFYQAGGTFTYNATVATAIGGYPLNARLWYTDSDGISMILRSTIGNNTNNFLTDPSVIGQVGDTSKPWVIENFMGIKGQYNLFDTKWSDYELDDMNWLDANTFSWQSGSVYSSAYGHLVDDIDGISSSSETVGSYTITYYQATDGHKIVLPDQETAVAAIYAESGVAWYYILDTTNTRFKLPRINPAREELLQIIRAKGDGKSLGLTNGTDDIIPATYTNGLGYFSKGTQVNVGDTITASNPTSLKAYGVDTNSTKSGIISSMTDSTSVYKGKKYLYFYVGQFSQSATEQTAGLNSELFNGKADIDLSNAAPNASASAKSIINGWGMPDFSSAVSKSSTVDEVQSVSSNGVLMVTLVKALQDSSRANYHIAICDSSGTVILGDVLCSRAGYEGSCSGGSVYLPKGTYFKVTSWEGLTNASLLFIPCLGG